MWTTRFDGLPSTPYTYQTVEVLQTQVTNTTMMQTFEVKVSIYEPEPKSMVFYQKALDVTNAINTVMKQVAKTTDLPQRACTVLAQPYQ